MVSVITYGRNDGHGYNLAKRAALSFNCLAEVLDDADDEIIFVDCNSEDDYATFPESIADTLTPKARALLRVYRVRRSLYRQRARGSHLPVLESFSRNVALRRANPRNPWVLSTNPDMILVPAGGGTLGEILKGLPGGYYATPRYELPESLWESFDRTAPTEAMQEILTTAPAMGLHLAVRGDPWNGYDAPGDFQLMPLRDAIEIGGFNEGMVRGWHVDSNLARRLSLFYRRPAHSLHDRVFAYHMMHLRMLTSGHTGKAIRQSNSYHTYIYEVNSPFLPDQPSDWGAPDVALEQVSLTKGRRRFWTLGQAINDKAPKPGENIEFVDYSKAGVNADWHANLKRIEFFLANAFDHLPAGLHVGVWSANSSFEDFMRRVAEQKQWHLALASYSPQNDVWVRSGADGTVPHLGIFDFTLHFLAQHQDAARWHELRSRFHLSLLYQLETLRHQVNANKHRTLPTLYCLGVTNTDIEELIQSITPNWEQTPFLLGFKRGGFAASDRTNKLYALYYSALLKAARIKEAARQRGHKTFQDKLALEWLRLIRRISAP